MRSQERYKNATLCVRGCEIFEILLKAHILPSPNVYCISLCMYIIPVRQASSDAIRGVFTHCLHQQTSLSPLSRARLWGYRALLEPTPTITVTFGATRQNRSRFAPKNYFQSLRPAVRGRSFSYTNHPPLLLCQDAGIVH